MPISRFSITDIPTKQPRPSGDCEMPSTGRSCEGMSVMSCPSKITVPARTGRSPEMVFMVVVLPAPFAPIRVTISPSSTVKLMSRIASIRP